MSLLKKPSQRRRGAKLPEKNSGLNAHFNMFALISSFPKDGTADANVGGALFNSQGEIIGHAH